MKTRNDPLLGSVPIQQGLAIIEDVNLARRSCQARGTAAQICMNTRKFADDRICPGLRL